MILEIIIIGLSLNFMGCSGREASLILDKGKEEKTVNKINIVARDMKFLYNTSRFKFKKHYVKANEKISLTLTNMDNMPHNFVLLDKGQDFTKFAILTQESAGEIQDFLNNWVNFEKYGLPPPIAYTRIIRPRDQLHHQTIEFILKEKGIYPFVCTVPGHLSMNGIIIAE